MTTKITHENREVLCQDSGRSSSDPPSRVLVSSRGPDRGLLVSPLSERSKSGDVLQREADHCPLGCPRPDPAAAWLLSVPEPTWPRPFQGGGSRCCSPLSLPQPLTSIRDATFSRGSPHAQPPCCGPAPTCPSAMCGEAGSPCSATPGRVSGDAHPGAGVGGGGVTPHFVIESKGLCAGISVLRPLFGSGWQIP